LFLTVLRGNSFPNPLDGYSNGGDPRPAAEKLKALGVEFYTFGIRNGNVKVKKHKVATKMTDTAR
jgi:hypothetical protein